MKYWVSVPGMVSRSLRDLTQDMLSLVMQALTGHTHLNYHRYEVDGYPNQDCRFCGEGCGEFINLASECPALTQEQLESFWEL